LLLNTSLTKPSLLVLFQYNKSDWFTVLTFNTVKPVDKIVLLFIDGENEAALYRLICYIEVTIKAGLTVVLL